MMGEVINTICLWTGYIWWGIILLVSILWLMDKYLPFMWLKCPVCEKRKRDFFHIWETNAERYGDGHRIVGDKKIKPNDIVCIQCCHDHKLFDNYKEDT